MIILKKENIKVIGLQKQNIELKDEINYNYYYSLKRKNKIEITFLLSSVIICIVVSLISFVTQSKNQIRMNCNNPNHIIVMTHGWAGTPSNMDVLSERIIHNLNIKDEIDNYEVDNTINLLFNRNCVLIYKVHSNWGYFRSIFITSDGIEQGAKRMSEEIKEVIKKNPSLEKISFIGHSLGGLYNRAVLPLLSNIKNNKKITLEYENYGLIGGLIPMNFISIGTPHKGVLSDSCTLFGFEILRVVFPWRWISILPTISQLLLMDKHDLLLDKMMNNMDMIYPLSWFKHRHAIGSIKGDMLVPPTSASLLPYCIKNDNNSQLFLNMYNLNENQTESDLTIKFKYLHPYLQNNYLNKNQTQIVYSNLNLNNYQNNQLIDWITIIDFGIKKTYSKNVKQFYYPNIENNRQIIKINQENIQQISYYNNIDHPIYNKINGNLDRLVWMKTSVFFKHKIHRIFSHQLMMFCFENWGYFLLGNNFQLLDHIIENMYY